METAIINSSRLFGEINAISSKSYAHRLLICDFISGRELSLDGITLSKDVLATFNALKALKNGETELDAGESGSTLRFLIPLVSAKGGNYKIKMHGKLKERPNDDLYSALKTGGVCAFTEGDTVIVNGKLRAGKFKIKADKSSQYLSGLLLALSSLEEKSKIVLETSISSSPYAYITIEVLKSYGYGVKVEDKAFIVGGKKDTNDNPVSCEGDWSNSAFFLVAGVISGEVTVKNLNINSIQADKEIFNIIKASGGNITHNNGEITTKKSNLKGFTASVKDCPDLAPILGVLGAYATGETTITDIDRLRLKESDRVLSTLTMLTSLGIDAKEDNGKIIIKGGAIKGGTVDGFNDHRIVMSSAVMALRASGAVKITGANAVEKSYPEFFSDLEKLGGNISAKI